MKRSALVILFLVYAVLAQAQVTRVSGRVYDAETKETLPAASVLFLGTETGTITDIDGYYQIQSTEKVITIEATYMGYEPQVMRVVRGENQRINFYLKPSAEQLSEIVLVYEKDKEWVNPAHILLDSVWANKEENSLDRFKSYKCSYYEKIEFDLNNLSREFINRRWLKPFKFAFDYMDTSALSGKNYLPVFLMENQYNVYYKKEGNKQEKELNAARVAGFSSAEDFNEFMGSLYQDIDLFENQIILFEKGFSSPLSEFGKANYRYYLTDSAMVDNKWCYEIRFIPKRKQELTFKGIMWIADTSFALQSISMQVTEDANFNWVTDLFIQQDYDYDEKIGWYLNRDHITMDFALTEAKNVKGLYGKKTAYFTDYEVNLPEERIDALLESVERDYEDEELERTEEQWKALRPKPLTETEAGVEEMVDSVKNTPAFKFMQTTGAALFTGYYELNGFDIGPIPQMFAYNEVEGFRLGLRARTYKTLDDPFRLYGHLTYGFRDENFKYGLGFKYLLDADPRLEVGAEFNRDMEIYGRGGGFSSSRMTLGSSLVASEPIDDLVMVEQLSSYVAFEPVVNLSMSLRLSNRQMTPRGAAQIAYKNPENPTELVNRLNTSEANFSLSWTPGRKFFGDGVERKRLLNNFPTISASYKKGFKNVLSSDFAYDQLRLYFYQPLNLGLLGASFLRIEALKTLGTAPYPLLGILPANETFIYSRNAFNTMRIGEFIADEYVTAMYEHHFDGLVFNHLPLIRHLKLREVISGKAVIGSISESNMALVPDGTNFRTPERIYYEIGGGIENIFKVFRVEAVWRMSYLEKPDVRDFAILGTVHVRF